MAPGKTTRFPTYSADPMLLLPPSESSEDAVISLPNSEAKRGLPFSRYRPMTTSDMGSDSLSVTARWEAWLMLSYSPATVEGYTGAAFRFFRHVRKPLSDITEADVVAWLETFSYRSHARVTYFNALKSLFSFAERHGEVEVNPITHVKVAYPIEKEPEALSEDQYEAIVRAAYRHSQLRGFAVEFLYYSGGRIGDIIHAKWEDVSDEGIVFRNGKGGKDRKVAWNDGLQRAVEGLRTYFGEHDRILPRSDNAVWTWVKTAGISAGIPGVHPHLFRSTAITHAAKRGARLDHVQKWIGHSKLSTTQRYVALDREDIDAVGRILDRPVSPGLTVIEGEGETLWRLQEPRRIGVASASGSERTIDLPDDSLRMSGTSF